MKRLLIALVCCILLVGVVTADTTILYETNDGTIFDENNRLFPLYHTSSGTAVTNNPADYVYCGFTTSWTSEGIFNYHMRGAWNIPTDTLGASAIIQSAKFSAYGNNKYSANGQTDLELIEFHPGNSSMFYTGDYQRTDFTPLAPNISYSSYTASGYNNWTLSNLSVISKTGNTTLMCDHSASVYNQQNLSQTWNYGTANTSGFRMRGIGYSSGTYKAFLTVTYQTTPTATFTPSTAITDYPDRLVTFTDASTGGNLTYNWSFNNVTGNNTWVVFSQVQNPTTIFTEGNWQVNLTVANAVGSSTSSPMWINLSKCNNGINCSMRKYTTNTSDIYRVRSVTNGTWADLITGAGTSDSTTFTDLYVYTRGALETNRYQYVSRYVLGFDTSELPNDASILAANISLYYITKYTTLGSGGIAITNYSNNGTGAAGAYQNFQNDRFASDLSISGLTSGYNNWTINALGLSNISKIGTTTYGARLSWDVDNTTPTWASNQYGGANFRSANLVTNIPMIEISYSLNTPPQSITLLTNNTLIQGQITWSWTNPVDSDFSHTIVYKDGAWLKNTSNATISDTWTGLSLGGIYTFSSRTCDLFDVCNETWVNQSANATMLTSEKIANKVTDTQNVLFVGTYIAVIAIVASLVGTSLFGRK